MNISKKTVSETRVVQSPAFLFNEGWNLQELGGLSLWNLSPPCLLICSGRLFPPPPNTPLWAALSTHLPSTEQKKRFQLPASKTFKLLMRILIN